MDIHLTVDEIVETLKRSSLTTVLVEGKDDIMIYRWIEQEVGFDNANFLSCGGRGKLLKVFERRDEFNHIKTIFVADKDCFVYDESIPNEYEDIIWTNGYSIENDLYHGKAVEKLLDLTEDVKFQLALKNFIFYYAYEIENYNKKIVYNFSNHPNEVLEDNHGICPIFLGKINFNEPNQETVNALTENYETLIRGKSLFALLLRFLSHRNRPIKHSKKSLLEHCYKLHKTDLIIGLIGNINKKLCA